MMPISNDLRHPAVATCTRGSRWKEGRKQKEILVVFILLTAASTYSIFSFASFRTAHDPSRTTEEVRVLSLEGTRTDEKVMLIKSNFDDAIRPNKKRSVVKKEVAAQNSTLNLDFFVIGFPKCGTTSLLFTFARHNETVMARTEQCSISRGTEEDFASVSSALGGLLEVYEDTKVGIKCPVSVWDARWIDGLVKRSRHTKLIVGVRHPVLFFQSYFNYRITEIHDHNLNEDIPRPESLIGWENRWKDVSTDFARYELSLMQLGKTELSRRNLQDLHNHGRRVTKNPFKVFLYSIEQLEDKNEERSIRFRSDMQEFLGVKSPLEPFERGNVNYFVGKMRYPETMDICQPRFNGLRAILIRQAMITLKWMRDEFIKSPDVTVGGRGYFLELIKSWRTDPCRGANSKYL